ncbi:DUF4291 domain-containing protein [Fulvivirga maritima]|uniref:DUF4291 domain-containing protein n=1 Tax=Fulvivirga maritima TaxID=2904247 RepID=UPI001F2B0F35|nr:DUF4291 domain-containing protein [Fulvivirga maritima]UII26730.1 DUF4291 domain-containing protein [Fulvivirga maritima]
MTTDKYEIRALYNDKSIAVYSAFSDSIADVAIQNQKLLPPFTYSRMTWIKPSFLWMMYRSDWGNRAGMNRILRIWINRKDWEAALKEAILITPEPHVYKNHKGWRAKLEKARVRVQWDPERDIENQRLDFKSIQVGITEKLSEVYAKKWISKIEDVTSLTHEMQGLVLRKNLSEAKKLLPVEIKYPVNKEIIASLGM